MMITAADRAWGATSARVLPLRTVAVFPETMWIHSLVDGEWRIAIV